jgi:hypothetical protein
MENINYIFYCYSGSKLYGTDLPESDTDYDVKNKKGEKKDYLLKQPISQIYNSIKKQIEDYGYRAKNIEKYGYETKFGSHLYRLLVEGIELVETNKIVFPLKQADYIRQIKQGKISFEELLKETGSLFTKFQELEKQNKFPTNPNTEEIEHLLITLIKKYLN